MENNYWDKISICLTNQNELSNGTGLLVCWSVAGLGLLDLPLDVEMYLLLHEPLLDLTLLSLACWIWICPRTCWRYRWWALFCSTWTCETWRRTLALTLLCLPPCPCQCPWCFWTWPTWSKTDGLATGPGSLASAGPWYVGSKPARSHAVGAADRHSPAGPGLLGLPLKNVRPWRARALAGSATDGPVVDGQESSTCLRMLGLPLMDLTRMAAMPAYAGPFRWRVLNKWFNSYNSIYIKDVVNSIFSAVAYYFEKLSSSRSRRRLPTCTIGCKW